MQYPALMGIMHCASEDRDQPPRLTRFVAADMSLIFISDFGFRASDLRERLAQIRPFDQAHAEIVLPLVFADLVNGHDVWMRQAGGRFGFGFEALDQLLGGQSAAADEFNGNEAV